MTVPIEPYQHLIAAVYGNRDLRDFKFSPEQATELVAICDQLINTASTLRFKDEVKAKDIILRRFGIGRPAETLRSIGLTHKISVERVRQIETRFLRNMKHPSRRFALQVFLARFDLVEQPLPLLLDPLDSFRERVRNGGILTDEELSFIKVDDMEFSVRACICFRHDNITTLAQLKQRSRCQLMWLTGFGHKTLLEVMTAMSEFGIGLREE